METHSSGRYKHHVLYFHVNTNKHYSSFSQSHHALCYTSEHLPHNPDKPTSSYIIIIIVSSQRGTLVLHFIQSWPELCFSTFLIMGLSDFRGGEVQGHVVPPLLDHGWVCVGFLSFPWRKWRVLLPFPLLCECNDFLSGVCCAAGKT